MLIPKITIEKKDDFETIGKQLDKLERHRIDYPNWTNDESYPEVTFRIAHNGKNIYLKFDVTENSIRAVAQNNNDMVWEDSCVEFFISFDDSGYYYNLEQTCIGVALMGYRKTRNESVHAADNILNSIKRWASLGKDNFELKEGSFNWTLISVIPVETFWMNKLSTFDKLKAKANFYKCGDKLSKPHFLSWSPVKTEQPNFHKTDFFKEITFE